MEGRYDVNYIRYLLRKVVFIGGTDLFIFLENSTNPPGKVGFDDRKGIFQMGCLSWKWMKFRSYSDRVVKINLNHVKIISRWNMFEDMLFSYDTFSNKFPYWFWTFCIRYLRLLCIVLSYVKTQNQKSLVPVLFMLFSHLVSFY